MMRRPKHHNLAPRPRLALAAAALCLLAAVCARAQAAPPDPSQLFREATPVGDARAPDAFEFELDGYAFRVAKNGNGRRLKGDQIRPFNLRLEDHGELRRVRFMGYEGNVLLLCGVDYGDEEGGFAYRLEQPSMRAVWSRDVPATGVEAVREGAALYLAGRGFIGRLDLATGLYTWQRGEAAEEKRSHIPRSDFERPELSGDAALFREARPAADGQTPRTFRVHKKSGKILGVDSSQ